MYHTDKMYTNLCVHLLKNLFTRHGFCIKYSSNPENKAATLKITQDGKENM